MLPAYTWDGGLKTTKLDLENIQNLKLFMIFEIASGGRKSGIMGVGYVVSERI